MNSSFYIKSLDKLSGYFELDLKYYINSGFWVVLGTAISFLGGIILSALFARLWPADVYGQYSFFTSIYFLITLTALPGMGQIVLQAAAEGKDGTYKEALRQIVKWSFVGSILLFVGSIYFFIRNNYDLSVIFFFSILAFPLSNTGNLYASFLSGKKKFKLIAILSTVYQIVTIGLTSFTLLYYSSLVTVSIIFLYSNALISIVVAIIAGRSAKNNIIDPKLLNFGKHLSFSQLFVLLVDQFDRFAVPLFLGFTNNAIYAFAILIPSQIHVFLKVFISLGQSKIAESSSRALKKNLLYKTLQLEAVVFLIVFLYILAAPFIFSILYPAYKNSALLLSQIYAISLLYYPSNFFSLGLIKYRAPKQVYFVNIICPLFTIISLIILTYLFGLMGAVVSRVISRFFQAFIQYVMFKTLAH